MNTTIFKLLIAATVLSFLSSLAYIGINYQENEAAAQAPGRGQNPPGRGSAADIGCSNRERGRRRAAGQSRRDEILQNLESSQLSESDLEAVERSYQA